jgi:hypothetical protein
MLSLLLLVLLSVPVPFAAEVVYSEGTLMIEVGDPVIGEFTYENELLDMTYNVGDGKLLFRTDTEFSPLCVDSTICTVEALETILFGIDHRTRFNPTEPDTLDWYTLNSVGDIETLAMSANVTSSGIPEPGTLLLLCIALLVLLLNRNCIRRTSYNGTWL